MEREYYKTQTYNAVEIKMMNKLKCNNLKSTNAIQYSDRFNDFGNEIFCNAYYSLITAKDIEDEMDAFAELEQYHQTEEEYYSTR